MTKLSPGEKARLLSALTEFVEQKSAKPLSLLCEVTSIDSVKNTCYCEPLADYADIQQVRLIPQGDKNGVLIIPKLNSIVTVSFFEDGSAYVAQVSEIDKVYITIDNSNKVVYDSTAWVWNGGSLGGMAKTAVLATKLNNLENLVNDLISKYNSHTHPIPVLATTCGAGAGTTAVGATTATGTTEPTTLTPTTQSEIEDTKIKH